MKEQTAFGQKDPGLFGINNTNNIFTKENI